jgi:hypothetical protein
MKREKNPPCYRQTGHWLTDALYTLPRENGTSMTATSAKIFKNRHRASEIAKYGKAMKDLDRFFAEFGYEIELVRKV